MAYMYCDKNGTSINVTSVCILTTKEKLVEKLESVRINFRAPMPLNEFISTWFGSYSTYCVYELDIDNISSVPKKLKVQQILALL